MVGLLLPAPEAAGSPCQIDLSGRVRELGKIDVMTIEGRDEPDAVATFGGCHFALSEQVGKRQPRVEANYAILGSGAILAWSDDASDGEQVARTVAFSKDLNPRIHELLDLVCADLRRRGRGYGQCPRTDPFRSIGQFCYMRHATHLWLEGRAIATWHESKQCVARGKSVTLALPYHQDVLSVAVETNDSATEFVPLRENQRSIKFGPRDFDIWSSLQFHARIPGHDGAVVEKSFQIDLDPSLPEGRMTFNRILDLASKDCMLQARALFQLLVSRSLPSPLEVREFGGVVRQAITPVSH